MVKQFFNALKSIPNRFLKWSFAIDTPVFIVTVFGKPVLDNIKIGSYGKMYDTLCAFLPWLNAFLSSSIAKFIVITYTVFCILILLTKKLYRPLAVLIKHSSLGYTIGDIDETFKQKFWFKYINIDISNLIETNIPEAIRFQDAKLQEIKAIRRRKCFYYGIAHTPLIFRLGYQVGLKDMNFLHSYQRGSGNKKFRELCEYDLDKYDFSRFDQENLESKSQELLVTIATTYPISKVDLACFNLTEMHTLEIEASDINMGTDFFSSYRKIISYCTAITDELRKICKQYNIKKIHIVLSTSVNFTFVLGQYLNNNQIPETIVYHYKKGEEPCYPWGISIQKDWDSAYINMKAADIISQK
ncbi:SAVED domain-containing protein [Faecalispora anaeroviscerum]|uniref:SAVED domain-containing protein n=1 Tax=Faecalispora anaeroviscerum TaxID=2991836 RepID=UPI0024BB413C|nr:SAVED domain-containing protein [Faecalispora anaeroviscerum]